MTNDNLKNKTLFWQINIVSVDSKGLRSQDVSLVKVFFLIKRQNNGDGACTTTYFLFGMSPDVRHSKSAFLHMTTYFELRLEQMNISSRLDIRSNSDFAYPFDFYCLTNFVTIYRRWLLFGMSM